MRKLGWVLSCLVLFLVVSYLIIIQSRTTTYGEFITNLLNDDESVDLVDIRYVDFKGNEKELTVTNEDEIKKIVELPSTMKLIRNSTGFSGAVEGIYILSLKTDKQRYPSVIMHLNDNGGMTVNSEAKNYNFKIAGKNTLLEALESFEYVNKKR